MQRIIWVLFLSSALFSSCISDSDRKIREAVSDQIGLYPELTLIDLYKAFFQAEFGAGHIVSDTAAAGRYLDYELSIPDSSAVLYEPIGADKSYFRVHLVCVQRGYISRTQLFEAFLRGVYDVPVPQICKWKESWANTLTVIDRMNLDLVNYDEDKSSIERLLQSGDYAVHHSDAFAEKYNPHYRIVRGDVFETDILPLLEKRYKE